MHRNVVVDGNGITQSVCWDLADVSATSNAGLETAVEHMVVRRLGALDGYISAKIIHPRRLQDSDDIFVRLSLRNAGLPGGKGGFGAQLRGATATKKTTNFGACRDLQGRRLRDVEDEKKLSEWQANRASKPATDQAVDDRPKEEAQDKLPDVVGRDPGFRKAEFQDSLEDAGDRIASVVAAGLTAEKRKVESLHIGQERRSSAGWEEPALGLSDEDGCSSESTFSRGTAHSEKPVPDPVVEPTAAELEPKGVARRSKRSRTK